MTYHPWDDLRDRYPHIHVELHCIEPARAFWAEDLNVIIVNGDLDRPGRRCALAHEIAHMDVGDRPTDMCWFSTRQENGADTLAARRLVDIGDLQRVLTWCDDLREVAAELDVTVDVLRLRGETMHKHERALVDEVLARSISVA